MFGNYAEISKLNSKISKLESQVEKLKDERFELERQVASFEELSFATKNYTKDDLFEGLLVSVDGARRRIVIMNGSWLLNSSLSKDTARLNVPEQLREIANKKRPVTRQMLYDYMKQKNYIISVSKDL